MVKGVKKSQKVIIMLSPEKYLDHKTFPKTTYKNLSFDEQRLLDIFNYEKIKEAWLKNYPLRPGQLMKWKELAIKLDRPYLPKDRQERLPFKPERKKVKNNDKSRLTVGQVAKATGLTKQGIYFYEKQGLIGPCFQGRIKYYSSATVLRIKKIRELERGYYLKVLKRMLDDGQL